MKARPSGRIIRQSGAAWFEALYGNWLVSGNAYAELVKLGGLPAELHALRPDRMKVVAGPDGWPEAYEYSVAGRSVRFPVEDGQSPILHLRTYHPLDDHYGFAPLEAAAVALDLHNAAGAWNKALLDNAARPSGALVYRGEGGANLSQDQFERLKRELEANYTGAVNAGRPLLLEGGLDWTSMALTPRDMDFMEAKHGAAREIALAHAAGHSGRQHLCELCRGQPRLLAPDRPAASRPHGRGAGGVAGAALSGRRAAARL
jgi:HK97 family phage portal protein